MIENDNRYVFHTYLNVSTPGDIRLKFYSYPKYPDENVRYISDGFTNPLSLKVGNSVSRSVKCINPDEVYYSGGFHLNFVIEQYQITNYPPSTPSMIDVPSIVRNGQPFTVSWGESTDSDGDDITYGLERRVNKDRWVQIYSGSGKNKIETALTSWDAVAYRVRAYDGKKYSEYRTSPTSIVTHNSSPELEISVPIEKGYFGKIKAVILC